MSRTELLAELEQLKPTERFEVFERLGELQERDLLNGTQPPEWEKEILDEALAEFQRDGNRGDPRAGSSSTNPCHPSQMTYCITVRPVAEADLIWSRLRFGTTASKLI